MTSWQNGLLLPCQRENQWQTTQSITNLQKGGKAKSKSTARYYSLLPVESCLSVTTLPHKHQPQKQQFEYQWGKSIKEFRGLFNFDLEKEGRQRGMIIWKCTHRVRVWCVGFVEFWCYSLPPLFPVFLLNIWYFSLEKKEKNTLHYIKWLSILTIFGQNSLQ